MNGTKIEWVKNPDGTQGYTSNPVRGECPIGCTYCYVKSLRNRFSWHRDIRFYPQELEAIQRHKKPCGIFLGSTIELFHDKTIGYMPEIIETIRACSQHRFYLLTKQPQNLPREFPENCWVGVTATNTEMLMQACSHLEYPVQAKLKYISIEPLLQWDFNWVQSYLVNALKRADIGWLIIGQQTPVSAKTEPKIEWIREIVEAADKAGIPVFLKDNLKLLLCSTSNGHQFIEAHNLWAFKEFQLRQEMPNRQNLLDIIGTNVLQSCHEITKGGGNHEDTGGCR